MFEYPEINTLAKQMRKELTGKTVKSGTLVKKNGNMFMGEKDAAKYSMLAGGTIIQIDALAPEIYIKLDNGYGILIRQSGGKILYNKTPADIPKNCNIIFEFTDASNLTYTMSLFTLGFFAITHDEWRNRKQDSKKFDPLGDNSFKNYMDFISNDAGQMKTAIKLFFSNNMLGISSSFAAEILLHAKIHPSTQLGKLNMDEHQCVYETMKRILKTACDEGGRTSEHGLYGQKGKYTAMGERKHIGESCPLCGSILEKNSVGGVTAYCSNCQRKK